MAKIVSFSLDRESLELFDKIESAATYKNRSELIRSALQLMLGELKQLQKMRGHTSAVIVVTHSERFEDGIAKIKHNFSDIITTQIHNNLHDMCMETFIVHGRGETISAFVKMLKENKIVASAKVLTVVEG